MKKIAASLLVGAMIFSQCAFVSAESSPLPVNKSLSAQSLQASAEDEIGTFIIYNKKAVNLYNTATAKGKTNNVVGPQVLKGVKKNGNYYLINTWLGQKWIYNDGNLEVKQSVELKLAIDLPYGFFLHTHPFAKDNTKSVVSPQRVYVKEATTDGWAKISTWLGDKWIYGPELEVVTGEVYPIIEPWVYIEENIPLHYDDDGYFDEALGIGEEYEIIGENQTHFTIDYYNEIIPPPPGAVIQVPKEKVTPFYREVQDGFTQQGNFSIYAADVMPLYHNAEEDARSNQYVKPQLLKGIARWGDWVLVNTWLGPKYINLNDAYEAFVSDNQRPASGTIALTKTTYLYNEPFVNSKFGGKQYIGPQTVQVVGKTAFFTKIKTWAGDKWIINEEPWGFE